MKFKDFQAPVLFSSTFKGLEFRRKKIQVLSSTFKDEWEPCKKRVNKKTKNDRPIAIRLKESQLNSKLKSSATKTRTLYSMTKT